MPVIVTEQIKPASPRKAGNRASIYAITLPLNDDSDYEIVSSFLRAPYPEALPRNMWWEDIENTATLRFFRGPKMIGQCKKNQYTTMLERLCRPSASSLYGSIYTEILEPRLL